LRFSRSALASRFSRSLFLSLMAAIGLTRRGPHGQRRDFLAVLP
jgi:hypothetical protein